MKFKNELLTEKELEANHVKYKRYHFGMVQKVVSENDTLSALGRRLEELFVQQFDRIAYHSDASNHHRKEDEQLSKLMVSAAATSTARVEAARAHLTLCDEYSSHFVRLLHEVSAEIDRVLLEVGVQLEQTRHQLDLSDLHIQDTIERFERWLQLSKDLQLARLEAVKTVAMRVETDKIIPTALLNSNGDLSQPLSSEQAARIQETMVQVTSMLSASSEANDRIQDERLPLAKALFHVPIAQESAPTPEAPKPSAQSVHPLEGFPWFRFIKVFYIMLSESVAALVVLLLVIYEEVGLALGATVVFGGILLLARMAFYYVTLGRTSVREKPGSGYLDLNDLLRDFEKIKHKTRTSFVKT